jgi:hypothetical protein
MKAKKMKDLSTNELRIIERVKEGKQITTGEGLIFLGLVIEVTDLSLIENEIKYYK